MKPTTEILAEMMAQKSNEDLLAVIAQPYNWKTEALDAARAELQKRKVDISTVVVSVRPDDSPLNNADIVVIARRQKALIWLIPLSLLSLPSVALLRSQWDSLIFM
jgi:hypothetical protein